MFLNIFSFFNKKYSQTLKTYLNFSLFSYLLFLIFTSLFMVYSIISCSKPKEELNLLRSVVDLRVGESQDVKLTNGDVVNVKLLEVNEVRDSVRDAVRSVSVKVAVDGKDLVLNSATYNLPVTFGKVQIDCPITKGYYTNANQNSWSLEKDARLRLWSAGSPFINPGTFIYPLKQRWGGNNTQMANEPTYVDWGEGASQKRIYYHDALDFGGADGMVEVIAATNGLVVSARDTTLKEYKGTPVMPRYDVVYVVDDRGWFYRYSHLYSIDSAIEIGEKVNMGQKIGMLGKEGASGGFAHLHFGISSKQPSGKWGTEEGYAYIWEAYINENHPPLIAVARPHKIAFTGETVKLDGSKSKSFVGNIVSYEWKFCDGTTASGPAQERIYKIPGEYSEILKVTDSEGNIDYDFTVVQIYNKKNPEKMPPAIHATNYPSLNIKVGDPVTFGVRTFGTEAGNEVWDFGDGSPKVTVKSQMIKVPEGYRGGYVTKGYDYRKGKYAETIHSFAKPGHYIVYVERSNEFGYKAIANLHIEVNAMK